MARTDRLAPHMAALADRYLAEQLAIPFGEYLDTVDRCCPTERHIVDFLVSDMTLRGLKGKMRARLGLSQRGLTREQLIAQLKQLHRKLGKVPGREDLDRASKTGLYASERVYRRVFGSFGAGVKAAGLEPTQFYNGRHRGQYSREELIGFLQQYAHELGRTPTHRDLSRACKEGRCPGPMTFYREFGSHNAALKASGLEPNQVYYTQEDLVLQLRYLIKSIGRMPTMDDVRRASKLGVCAHPTALIRAFGSFVSALRAAEEQQNPVT